MSLWNLSLGGGPSRSYDYISKSRKVRQGLIAQVIETLSLYWLQLVVVFWAAMIARWTFIVCFLDSNYNTIYFPYFLGKPMRTNFKYLFFAKQHHPPSQMEHSCDTLPLLHKARTNLVVTNYPPPARYPPADRCVRWIRACAETNIRSALFPSGLRPLIAGQ